MKKKNNESGSVELFFDKTFGVICKIVLQENSWQVNISEEIKINNDDLLRDIADHSGKFSWWSMLLVQTKSLYKKQNKEISNLREQLDLEARDSLKEEGIKVTENAVTAWINQDPRIKNKDLSGLEMLINTIESVLESFNHRRDMLKESNRLYCSEQYNEKH